MANTAFRMNWRSGCVRISQLDGRRVALWGWGREGRAAWRAIRGRLPHLPLTVLCRTDEAAAVADLGDAHLDVQVDPVDADLLAAFDLVVKSPGISLYAGHVVDAAARGTRFIGGTALWFAERADVHALCVTGTKGKSTTAALLAHLLRAAGRRTALAGNIGMPLLELLDAQADDWVIELSSYQTGDVAVSGTRPALAIVTNVFPEHLDWHGSEQRYVADKLSLLTAAHPHIAVLNAADAQLRALSLPHSRVIWFNQPDGWHLRDGVIHRADQVVLDTAALPIPGVHNRGNLCGVLAALDALGHDAAALAAQAADFQPLPHRLQPLGTRDGVLWVNDSISTTPHATLAALQVHADRPVALLVGGHDRGLDWSAFAAAMRTHAPRAIVAMGQNGPRIHALLQPLAAQAGFVLQQAGDLAEAVQLGCKALDPEGGVLLLSPGAPSFGAYADYVARGRHFAELGGFDPATITAIAGLGIA